MRRPYNDHHPQKFTLEISHLTATIVAPTPSFMQFRLLNLWAQSRGTDGPPNVDNKRKFDLWHPITGQRRGCNGVSVKC